MLLLTLSCSVELVRHLQTISLTEMPEKFDIYSKIFYMDVEKFVRHLCRLVLRHQMPVWNYFVKSFYSVPPPVICGTNSGQHMYVDSSPDCVTMRFATIGVFVLYF